MWKMGKNYTMWRVYNSNSQIFIFFDQLPGTTDSSDRSNQSLKTQPCPGIVESSDLCPVVNVY